MIFIKFLRVAFGTLLLILIPLVCVVVMDSAVVLATVLVITGDGVLVVVDVVE